MYGQIVSHDKEPKKRSRICMHQSPGVPGRCTCHCGCLKDGLLAPGFAFLVGQMHRESLRQKVQFLENGKVGEGNSLWESIKR